MLDATQCAGQGGDYQGDASDCAGVDCSIPANNDDCADAVGITDGATAYSTLDATTDGPQHGGCEFDGQTYEDIWFTYQATCTGTLTVTTCEQLGGSADYDTDLVVYEGVDCGNLVLLGCNDDDGSNPCGGGPDYHSTVQVQVSAGASYLIRVGGYNPGDAGTGVLFVACEGEPIVDCNGNGIDDLVDIADGTSADCNNNFVPDECDIASGASDDCDGGPLGDLSAGATLFGQNCQGCHGVGGVGGVGPNIQDRTRVFLWNKLLPPTDHFGGEFPGFEQQDFADLEVHLNTTGTSIGRPDLVPDECQFLDDCDGDGTTDGCELDAGTQIDTDFNGVPDDCELGACCFADGTCTEQMAGTCSSLGGVFQGGLTTCAGTNCPQPEGACCFGSGTCQLLTATDCDGQSGTYQGDFTDCVSTNCPQPEGACCFLDGACAPLTGADCASQSGTYQGDFISCASANCPQPEGACCFADGTCSSLTATDCAASSGTYQGDFSDCGSANCPQPAGACCLLDGTCTNGTADECAGAGGVYQGDFSDCGKAQCPQPEGACCFVDGTCADLTSADCAGQGGSYQGDFSDCGSANCPQPT
ncbi:MAG: hypothetical protein ACYTF9_08795, partial [Planctomycetota bacterium]